MSSNKTLRGCGCSFRGSPALRSLPAATSSSKGPNLILGDSDGGEAMGIPSGSWRILAPFLRRKQNKRNSFSDLNTNPKLTRNKHAAHCRIQANWIFCAHQGWPRDGGTEVMKQQTRLIVFAFVVVLVTSIGPFAQGPPAASPTENQLRYRLVDVGTFGGPNSQTNGTSRIMNNFGVVAGMADSDQLCPQVSGLSPGFVSPAFMWRQGVLTNIGLLPGGCAS